MTILDDNKAQLDLKQLLILIDDDLDLEADLCLDLDCHVVTENPSKFVRLLRTVITHIRTHARGPISIGLSALRDSFDIAIVGHTDLTEIPEEPPVKNEFEIFGGTGSFEFLAGKYIKALIHFERPET